MKRKKTKKKSKNPLTKGEKFSIIDERSQRGSADRSLKIEQHEISSTELRELKGFRGCAEISLITL